MQPFFDQVYLHIYKLHFYMNQVCDISRHVCACCVDTIVFSNLFIFFSPALCLEDKTPAEESELAGAALC